MQRELYPTEISNLLARQFDLDAKVLAHRRIVELGQWSQSRMVEWNLPIPTRGVVVQDDVYGQVVVFPDGAGLLHFNGWVADTSRAPGMQPGSEIVKGQYESASGNTLDQMLSDLKRGVGGLALLGVLVFLGYKFLEKQGYV